MDFHAILGQLLPQLCGWPLVGFNNRLMIQWGFHYGNYNKINEINGTLTFPISFPTKMCSACATAIDFSDIVSLHNWTPSTIEYDILERNASFLVWDNFLFMCIGY